MRIKTTSTGVKLTPVNIKGKDYITVNQRIAEVNASAMVPRYQILETKFFEFGGLYLCQVKINIAGQQFIGTASVNIGGRGVDATNPIENAETSAIGRALGLAGFGSLESVASAEEVVSAISRQSKPAAGQSAPAQQAAQQQAALPLADDEDREAIKKLCQEQGIDGLQLKDILKEYGLSWSKLAKHEIDILSSAIFARGNK